MATRFSNPSPQYFYNGTPAAPLSNGLMFFYDPGTLDLKNTYSDNALSVANSNPVVLSSSGVLPSVFLDGPYRVILTAKYDSNGDAGVQQWDLDNINSVTDLAFSDWDASIDYGIGGANIVYSTDGQYYVSIATPNISHDPASEANPEYWELIQFVARWNANVTYAQDEIVQGSDGYLYNSIAGSNLNHNPTTDTTSTYWEPALSSATTTRKGILEIATDAETNTGTSAVLAVPPAGLSQYTPRRGFIDGLTLSNAADADHDITVAIGDAMDSTNAVRMVLASALTKQIDATWAVGNNAGGLAATLTVANTTWYHVFEVVVAGVVDAMFDTSVTCATGVANNAVTSFRRIGSVLTNGSANIIAFRQIEDYFYWDVPVEDADTSNPGTSVVSVTLSTPLGVACLANVSVVTFFTGGSIGAAALNILITDSTQTDTTPTDAILTIRAVLTGSTDTYRQTTSINHFTNTSSQLRYKFSASDAGVGINLFTQGWMDLRGKA